MTIATLAKRILTFPWSGTNGDQLKSWHDSVTTAINNPPAQPLATPSAPGAMPHWPILAADLPNAINGLIALSVATTGYDAAVVFSRGTNAAKVSVGGYGDGNGSEAHVMANGYLDSGGSLVQYDATKPTWAFVLDARSTQNKFSLQVKRVGEGVEAVFSVTSQGSVVCGRQIATNSTDGFFYMPTCAGKPTGVPTTQAGTIPVVYDTVNHRMWAYDNGEWS
jgi:hypothetical protein